MPKSSDLFVRAGSEATRKDLLGVTWPVYGDFEVENGEDALGNEDVFLYAPFRPPPAEPRRVPTKRGRVYGVDDMGRDEGLKRLYAPLRDVPDLFLRFANLGRKRSLWRDDPLQVMFEWATTYGVLGLEGVDYLEGPGRSAYRQGRCESLASFMEAVRSATKCLELYEAATAPDGPDEDSLERYSASGDTPQAKREWALIVAGDIVGEHVNTDCYPMLYRTLEKGDDGGAVAWHDQKTVGFEQGWGFHSLLGAMYLQMMMYMTEGGEGRRCKRPNCYRLVTFDPPRPPEDPGLKKGARGKYRTRSDKEFCSDACTQWWSDNFGDSKKAREKRERQRRKSDTSEA